MFPYSTCACARSNEPQRRLVKTLLRARHWARGIQVAAKSLNQLRRDKNRTTAREFRVGDATEPR